MDDRRWSRLHFALGALACVVLPGASWLDGSGRLAYTMFADVEWMRLEIAGLDANGRSFAISPTLLAPHAGAAGPFFAGADHDHLTPSWRTPQAHTAEMAQLACVVETRALRVTVTLYTRTTESGPANATSGSAVCRR